MAVCCIIGAVKAIAVESLQNEAGILSYEHRLKYISAKKASRLYFGYKDANPIKQYLYIK